MVEIVEVKTSRQQREFLNFPLKLYKDNPYFVPPLWGDEKKIFRPDYVYYDTSEAVYYNAYRDGVMVGRISGILQKASNELRGEKRVRFTRFDAINDQQVADALFKAVEDWALSKGMDTVCGPLGFSDLEREGLLIEGFDQLSTFEEQYNAEYYGTLIENCGYAKEVDWLEHKLFLPEKDDGRLEKMADYIMKRYELHFGEAKNTNDFVRKHIDSFFRLIDDSYASLYGTVPITENVKKMLRDNFSLLLDMRYIEVVYNEKDEPVCFGVCFPSIGEALQPSGGHLTPLAIVKILRAKHKPKAIDLGLVGVAGDYVNKGVGTVIIARLYRTLRETGADYAETNLNLEDNTKIIGMWKCFKTIQHKRRRAYVKKLKAYEKGCPV